MIYYLHSWSGTKDARIGEHPPLNGRQGGHRYARSSYDRTELVKPNLKLQPWNGRLYWGTTP